MYLDDELNRIAQAHADDMNLNNYLSHTDRMGRSPGQRAKDMGFTDSIGENIAHSTSLTEVHLNLERSAIHLENTVSPMWTRVGIGISRNAKGEYYVAY